MKVNVLLVEYEENAIVLPNSFKSLLISELAFGRRTKPCRVYYHQNAPQNIYVSTSLSKELLLPDQLQLNVFVHQGCLHLGPVVGILSAGFTKSPLRPLGKRSMMFAKYIESSKNVGAYSFIFGAHQIDWKDESILGYLYTKKGWQKVKSPFPHVLYNRLPNRKVEKLDSFQHLMKELEESHHIPTFNDRFLSKKDIIDALFHTPCRKHLPETIASPSIQDVVSILNRHGTVFLKPINGSLGRGVFKLTYSHEEKLFYARYLDENNEKRLTKYASINTFFKHTFQHRDLSNYIVQQGIPLLHNHHLPIDFRVHMNKNEHGKWVFTAAAAKMAGRGSVTTHLKDGGTIQTTKEVESHLNLPYSINQKLKTAAQSISHELDQRLNGYMGELGYDFGIDKNGNVWLFEANSKPGRSIFHHEALKGEDQKTREYVYLYAKHLMKQTITLRQVHYEK